jgi:CheY-like chemotaxis protein
MENAKILIVDDDVDLTKAMQVILESRQYTVTTAENKTEGMAKAKAENPDLIILDVMMITWQDGFDLARELKDDPQCRDIPLLMLTSLREKTGIDVKLSPDNPNWCPVEGFLDKPVESDVLLAEVEKILQK